MRLYLTFDQCVIECIRNRELVAEFDRLQGTNLSLRGNWLDLQIDLACGRLEDDVQLFVYFVEDVVWNRLQGERRYREAVDEENGL